MADPVVVVDASELHALVADLGRVPDRALDLVDAVVERAAVNVKKDLAGQARWSKHFHGMADSVTYDRRYQVGAVGYEVGPDKELRGGALGNIFFFGVPGGGGGTGDLDGAVKSEEPYLVRALTDVAGGLL